MKKSMKILLTVIVIVLVAITVAVALNTGDGPVMIERQVYSEEQASDRLETLKAAQSEREIKVIPMQFFVQELHPDEGTFALTAVTTMREEDIAAVSFRATNSAVPDLEKWYDARREGIGRYTLSGSAADLGGLSGTYTIEAFITPAGGGETEAGKTEIEMTLSNFFSTEALGEGKQSLTLAGPQTDQEITGIRFKVWSMADEQDDIRTYDAREDPEGVWKTEIDVKDFEGKGSFVANAYVVYLDKDNKEQETGIASERFELLPEPLEVPEGAGEVIEEGKRVYVKVPEILQNPELPTGCESVALTIDLVSMGFELEKTEIMKNYLEIGTDMATSYVGDPYSKKGAGCFPPAITAAANKFLEEKKDTRRAHNITGTPIDELCQYIENGSPVILWSSMYMANPAKTNNVYSYQGKTYTWYRSEHCVVLYGYDKGKKVYLVSDPLNGLVERDAAAFEKIYDDIGRYAVVIY